MITEIAKRSLQIQRYRMRNGYVVFFSTLLVFFESCCVAHHQGAEAGLQQDISLQHYRAVMGEAFMVPCLKCVSQHQKEGLSRAGEGREENECPSWVRDCGRTFITEAKHSGKYTCFICGRRLSFHLQVVEKHSIRCSPEETSVYLLLHAGAEVPCPGLSCSNNTNVTWYKGNKAIPQENLRYGSGYRIWVKNGSLHLRQVYEDDSGEYFCDRQIIEGGVKWTIRRAVNITPLPQFKASYSPRIMYPADKMTEEVELGQPHSLECEVYFPLERNLSLEVHWYVHYNGNTNNTVPLPMERPEQAKIAGEIKVTQRTIIEEVTPQHLNNRYTCSARNTNGNNTVTINLKRKIRVKWPSLVGYPFVSLLLVAGLGIFLHTRWLELQLIYRSHFQQGKHNGEEFDVFLSYVWGPTPAQDPLSGLDIDAEAHLDNKDLLTFETERRLEVLLPQVLEDQWGYRLCLLERDVLPGGVYTNDVILAIQRSRMLLCVLSPDYLSNSNAVFVLESGIQALLQNSNFKLLLIWTSRAKKSHIQPDPPLSNLVQRALRVLPSLDWTSGKSTQTTKDFWKSLRKAMPTQRK